MPGDNSLYFPVGSWVTALDWGDYPVSTGSRLKLGTCRQESWPQAGPIWRWSNSNQQVLQEEADLSIWPDWHLPGPGHTLGAEHGVQGPGEGMGQQAEGGKGPALVGHLASQAATWAISC